ncbi:hypothetical protein EON79_05700 [bacterium]|nr:MAG: hypothetical protein EON79_05700 [bacterium]
MNRNLPCITLALVLVSFGAVLSGCGDSSGPDPSVEKARVNKSLEMRKIFDSVGGDYSKLQPADKTAFDAMAGGDGQKMFDEMKNGPSAAPSTGPTQ